MDAYYEQILIVFAIACAYSSVPTAEAADGCPSQVNLGNLTGEALYERIVRIHANTSFDVAVAARQNEGVAAAPNSSLDLVRQFSESGGIMLGIAYGLTANNNTQQCLSIAKMVVTAIGGVVAHRNDTIPPPITGEAALQCLVKQKGEVILTILAIGNSAQSGPYPGPYFRLLTGLVEAINRIRAVAANNDATTECTSASSAFAINALAFVRLDHSDAEVKKAYALS